MSDNRRVDFERLKTHADFATVLRHYGFNVPSGRTQLKICCPFHDDERPSCSVNLDRKVFNCHAGGCGVSGNVLDFVWRMENRDGAAVSLRQAGQILAEICSMPLRDARQSPQEGHSGAKRRKGMLGVPLKGKPAPTAPSGSTEATSKPEGNRPLGFTLTLDPEHRYLAERGLSRETIEAFGLGYCSRGSMTGRVCIPIHNEAGELVAYLGRWALDEPMPEGDDKYKLPGGFEKRHVLFNLHRVKHCTHLTLVEGAFSVIRLHRLRIPAIALLGCSLAEEQVALLMTACPKLRYITVLLDGDQHGRKAAETVVAWLSQHFWVRTVVLPDGAQPDTLAEAKLRVLLGWNREH